MKNYIHLQFKVLANPEFYGKTEIIPLWTMKDGGKISVSDMEESHIRNTIRLIKNKSFMSTKTTRWVRIFENELKLRN